MVRAIHCTSRTRHPHSLLFDRKPALQLLNPVVVSSGSKKLAIDACGLTIHLTQQSRHNDRFFSLTFIRTHQGYNVKLDCAQRVQTSAKASNLNQKWSGIRIQISGLIRICIRMSAGSLPKCCGFIILSALVISRSVVKIGHWLYEKSW